MTEGRDAVEVPAVEAEEPEAETPAEASAAGAIEEAADWADIDELVDNAAAADPSPLDGVTDGDSDGPPPADESGPMSSADALDPTEGLEAVEADADEAPDAALGCRARASSVFSKGCRRPGSASSRRATRAQPRSWPRPMAS